MDIEIRRLGPADEEAVLAAAFLFDDAPVRATTHRFLGEPNHHLLIAYDTAGDAVGFITGVETTHPDKGTEMFLYELGVAPPSRRQGIGTALVKALATLAKRRGCYDMWVGTENDNVAARRTYQGTGARATEPHLILEWDFTT